MATGQEESRSQRCCHDMSVRTHGVHFSWADEYGRAEDWPWGRSDVSSAPALLQHAASFYYWNSSTEWPGLAWDTAAAVFFSSFPKNTNDCVYERGLSGKTNFSLRFLTYFFHSVHYQHLLKEVSRISPWSRTPSQHTLNHLNNWFRTLVYETYKVYSGSHLEFVLPVCYSWDISECCHCPRQFYV